MSRVFSVLLSGLVACGMTVSPANRGVAAESTRAISATASPTFVPDLFEAEEQQQVSIKYIPNDSRSAQIIVTNRTQSPQTLRLPANFAGVPVLAQLGRGGGGMGGGGMGGGGQQGGFASAGIGGGQAMGGGAMGGQGMGGMGGMGGGAFSIPPERTRVFRVPTVCLEHGKREPSSRMHYKLVRTDSFSSDPKLAVVLECLGRGELSQKVAQAAVWHIANGLSWEKLAAEKIDHAGGIQDEPYFTHAELFAAHRVVALATEEARRRQPASAGEFVSPGELAQ